MANFFIINQQYGHLLSVKPLGFGGRVDVANLEGKRELSTPAPQISDHVFAKMAMLTHVNQDMAERWW